MAGSYPVSSPTTPDVSGSITVEPGKAYSIVVRGRAAPVTPLQDPIEANPDKSAVYLYNLTSMDGVELFAPKPNVAIVQSVPSGKSGFRSVNAVSVDTEFAWWEHGREASESDVPSSIRADVCRL